MLCISVIPTGQFQKISILLHRLGMEFPGGRGAGRCSVTPQNLKEMYEAYLEWGKEWIWKNPFCGGDKCLDIFWNYTIVYYQKHNYADQSRNPVTTLRPVC